jgi:hypothetical protein
MPQCLLDFCAQKAGYDVVIERWKQGGYTEHLSVVRHPGDALLDYLQRSFIELKRKQAKEIRKERRPGDESSEQLNLRRCQPLHKRQADMIGAAGISCRSEPVDARCSYRPPTVHP